jgi:hypothetical protein
MTVIREKIVDITGVVIEQFESIEDALSNKEGKLLDFRTINIKMISSKIKLENDATTKPICSEAKRSGEEVA